MSKLQNAYSLHFLPTSLVVGCPGLVSNARIGAFLAPKPLPRAVEAFGSLGAVAPLTRQFLHAKPSAKTAYTWERAWLGVWESVARLLTVLGHRRGFAASNSTTNQIDFTGGRRSLTNDVGPVE